MMTKLPKIGVYAGSGTSHSWLWFVDLFENAGLYDLVFIDEFNVHQGMLKALDVLVISGGDTFAVAEALGEKGAKEIERFVGRNGIYIGSCAGAYLPMKSSKKPLDLFNFVNVKITNLSKILPKAAFETCKFSTAYGCDFIFHPVRESVSLSLTQTACNGSQNRFNAPLYGGPGMIPEDPSWTLAEYSDFTKKTLFLTDRQIAEATLFKHAAVVRVPYQAGCFYLLGPHLEHPGYKKANQFIVDAIWAETRAEIKTDEPACSRQTGERTPSSEIITGRPAKQRLVAVKRELSNSRIAAGSLEFVPVQWLIGQKVYEPQKIRVFIEAMWKRLLKLEKKKILLLRPGLHEQIVRTAQELTRNLRKIKKQVDGNQIDKSKDSLETAEIVFTQLHRLSISFFELYFETMFNNRRGHCISEDIIQGKK